MERNGPVKSLVKPLKQYTCPHCNLRPCRSVHAKSCEDCVVAARRKRKRAYRERTREHRRAYDRKLYAKNLGNVGPNPKAAAPDMTQFMVGWNLGILPHQIQEIPPERLEDAIQKILDLRITAAAVEQIPRAIREDAHRRITEAKRKLRKGKRP